MSAESDRAQSFVLRLLGNPALRGLSELQREEQIIQFLHANAAQLAPTLAAAPFFPGKTWHETFDLLIQSLFRTTDERMFPSLKSMMESRISFSFIPFLDRRALQPAKVETQVYTLLTSLMKKPDARRSFTGAYAALWFDICERYLEQIFARKSYVHFELTKVQRLRMSKEEIRGMVLATLLLKPAVHVLTAPGSAGQPERVAGTITMQFAEKVIQVLLKRLSTLPEQLIRSAVNASISFTDNRFIEATARLASVFSARCRNYNPEVRVDRGADTPDKSWLSTARRNYRFYGFDIKMLDELYSIAAENGW